MSSGAGAYLKIWLSYPISSIPIRTPPNSGLKRGKEDSFLWDLSKVSAKISRLEEVKKSQPQRERLNRFFGEHYAGRTRAGTTALRTTPLLITFGLEDFASHAIKGSSVPLYLTISTTPQIELGLGSNNKIIRKGIGLKGSHTGLWAISSFSCRKGWVR